SPDRRPDEEALPEAQHWPAAGDGPAASHVQGNGNWRQAIAAVCRLIRNTVSAIERALPKKMPLPLIGTDNTCSNRRFALSTAELIFSYQCSSVGENCFLAKRYERLGSGVFHRNRPYCAGTAAGRRKTLPL